MHVDMWMQQKQFHGVYKMSNRIAVLGCSHTAWDQVHFRPDNHGCDWVEYLAQQYPQWQFHNHAQAGHGPLWYDTILKHIATTYEPNYYSAVIVQFTVSGRWFMPSNSYNFLQLPDHTNPEYATQYETANYRALDNTAHRTVLTQHHPHFRGEHSNHKRIQKFSHDLRAMYEWDHLVQHYESNFEQLCEHMYAPWIKHWFKWDWSDSVFAVDDTSERFSQRNNIGHDKPFKNWAIQQLGLETFVDTCLDSGLHCSEQGNLLLAHEYINNSAIGDFLKAQL